MFISAALINKGDNFEKKNPKKYTSGLKGSRKSGIGEVWVVEFPGGKQTAWG